MRFWGNGKDCFVVPPRNDTFIFYGKTLYPNTESKFSISKLSIFISTVLSYFIFIKANFALSKFTFNQKNSKPKILIFIL